MPATMLWDMCESIVIGVHGEVPPSDADWDAWEKYARQMPHSAKGWLVLTPDGVGPNGVQRAKVQGIKEIPSMPTAILTSSAVARGIVTAIRWFGKDIRAFSPDDTSAALNYLGVSPEGWPIVLRNAAELRGRLAGSTLETVAGTTTDRSTAFAPTSSTPRAPTQGSTRSPSGAQDRPARRAAPPTNTSPLRSAG